MTLVRWQPRQVPNPWPRLDALQRHFNRLFDSALTDDENMNPVEWSPRVDVVELENEYKISTELPGLKKENVKIEVQKDMLTISGEKQSEHEKKDRNIHISERVYGSFSRSFRLPSNTEPDKIKAEFKDGVLNLALPKTEEAKPKQIEISVN